MNAAGKNPAEGNFPDRKETKVFVIGPDLESPWGGGNQFLRALRSEFQSVGSLASSLRDANTAVVNSHHWESHASEIWRWKKHNPTFRVVHRLDGLNSATRSGAHHRLADYGLILFNFLLSDGTVFQSRWSQIQFEQAGLNPGSSRIILNAADTSVFFSRTLPARAPKQRKVVTSGWSTNRNKGFDLLEQIVALSDPNLFEFTYIGNTPRPLRGVKVVPPLSSEELGRELRRNHFYLSVTTNDACSNSLIEGIQCGLIPIFLNSGGNPEIGMCAELGFDTAIEASNLLREKWQTLTELSSSRIHPQIQVASKDYLDYVSSLKSQEDGSTHHLSLAMLLLFVYSLKTMRFTYRLASRALSVIRAVFLLGSRFPRDGLTKI